MERKNKIVFVIPLLGSGGAERVVAHLANELCKTNEVIIITVKSGEVAYPISPEITHINLNVNTKNKLLRALKRYSKLKKLLRAHRDGVVVAFDRNYGVTAALRAHCHVIGSERNDPYSNMKPRSFEARLRNYLYRHADHVVFQTPYAKGYFSEKIQAHSTIIPNPVLTPSVVRAEATEKIVLAACRLEKQKNLPMMLRAFAAFHERHPDYILEICGDGHLKGEVERLAEELGITPFVSLVGFVTDLPARMARAAMYISTSDYEGISNSMLEALAIGLPTICTDCPAGGAAMAIQDHVNGLLVPVGDTDAFAHAMCEMIEDDTLRASVTEASVKIRDAYSIEKIAAAWQEVIDGVRKGEK